MDRNTLKTVFVANTIAGFGFATGLYTASLFFIPFVELLSEMVHEKRTRRDCGVITDDEFDTLKDALVQNTKMEQLEEGEIFQTPSE